MNGKEYNDWKNFGARVKKARNSLPIQRKAVLLQADYYHKKIRD